MQLLEGTEQEMEWPTGRLCWGGEMSWNDGMANILTTARSEVDGPYSKADPLLCLHSLRQRLLLSCPRSGLGTWGRRCGG